MVCSPFAAFSSIYPGCIAESPLFREKRAWFRKYFPIFMKYITGGFVGEEEAGMRLFQVSCPILAFDTPEHFNLLPRDTMASSAPPSLMRATARGLCPAISHRCDKLLLGSISTVSGRLSACGCE